MAKEFLTQEQADKLQEETDDNNGAIDFESIERLMDDFAKQLTKDARNSYSSEQMEEAYRDGYENDHPNEWNFNLKDYS